MAEKFERHRQPWKSEEIAKALNRSEESTKERAKADNIGIAKLR